MGKPVKASYHLERKKHETKADNVYNIDFDKIKEHCLSAPSSPSDSSTYRKEITMRYSIANHIPIKEQN